MKIRMKIIIGLITLCSVESISQNIDLNHVGYYSDKKGIMASDILILKDDGRFEFTTLDPDLGEIKQYTNQGNWISKGNEIILNPEKTIRPKEFTVLGERIDSSNLNYIILKINYTVVEYEKEELKRQRDFGFDNLYMYLNSSPNLYVGRRNPKKSKELKITKDNIIRLKKKDLEIDQLTRVTLDFDGRSKYIFEPKDRNSNYFELELHHSLDIERTPRNRRILIKGKKAYIHNYDGKIDKSIFGMGLKKRKKL